MVQLAGNSTLRSGYSTGSCVAAALRGALELLVGLPVQMQQRVPLPVGGNGKGEGDPAEFAIITLSDCIFEPTAPHPPDDSFARFQAGQTIKASVIKPVNDDEDATKGALLEVRVGPHREALEKELSPLSQNPRILLSRFSLFAGRGVGVVTKPGLKVSPGFPAINPGPLWMMEQVLVEFQDAIAGPLCIVVGAPDGEAMAKKTANEKVGVMGGISILGSRGIVKPLSNDAYLESLATEVSVALRSDPRICLTLGNTSLSYAKNTLSFSIENIVETGNFVYETMRMITGEKPTQVTFIAGTGKMARIALGYKNTHSHQGEASVAMLDFLRPLFPEVSDWETVCNASTFRELEEMALARGKSLHGDLVMAILNRALVVIGSWWAEGISPPQGTDNQEFRDGIRLILLDHLGEAHSVYGTFPSRADEYKTNSTNPDTGSQGGQP